MTPEGLSGRRVLVVEDDALLAIFVQDMLIALGCEVVGPLHTLSEGLDLVACGTPVDVAILDMNLNGQSAFPLADALRACGVPVIFSTGYGESALRACDTGSPMLRKPFRAVALPLALAEALALP